MTNHPNRKKTERAVLVTTSHRGVFFGYATDTDGAYWKATLAYFSVKWPKALQERLSSLQSTGAKIPFWRSGSDARACNGGSNNPVYPGLVETSKGPLSLCAKGTLHATLIPPKWKGERWWVVALIGEVVGDDEKYGCLTREIIGECL